MRNSIAVVSGVILSVVLNLAGSRLVWLLITGENSKDAFVRGQLWQILFVVPLVSVVVGCVVASIVARSAWWLGGTANMPLFIYAFVRDAHGIYIVLSVIHRNRVCSRLRVFAIQTSDRSLGACPTGAWSGLAVTVPLFVVTWASRSSTTLDGFAFSRISR